MLFSFSTAYAGEWWEWGKWGGGPLRYSCEVHTEDTHSTRTFSFLSYRVYRKPITNSPHGVKDVIAIHTIPVGDARVFDDDDERLYNYNGVSVKFDFGLNNIIYIDNPLLYSYGAAVIDDLYRTSLMLLSPPNKLLKNLMEKEIVVVTLVSKADRSVLVSNIQHIFDLTGSAKSIMEAKTRCKNTI